MTPMAIPTSEAITLFEADLMFARLPGFFPL